MARGRQAAAVPAPTTRTLRSQSRAKNSAGQQVAPAANQAIPAPPPAPAPAPAEPLHNLRSRSRPGVTPVDAPAPPRAATANKKRGRGDVAVDAPAPAPKRAKSSKPAPPQEPSEVVPSAKKKKKKKKATSKKKRTKKKRPAAVDEADEADDESEIQDVAVVLDPASSSALRIVAGPHLQSISANFTSNIFAPAANQPSSSRDGGTAALGAKLKPIDMAPASDTYSSSDTDSEYDSDSSSDDEFEAEGESEGEGEGEGAREGKGKGKGKVKVEGRSDGEITHVDMDRDSNDESDIDDKRNRTGKGKARRDERDLAEDPTHRSTELPPFVTPERPMEKRPGKPTRKQWQSNAAYFNRPVKRGAYKSCISRLVTKELSQWVHHVWRNKPTWMTREEWLRFLFILSRICGLGPGKWINRDITRNVSRMDTHVHVAYDAGLLLLLPTERWLKEIDAVVRGLSPKDLLGKKFPLYSDKFPDKMRNFVLIPVKDDLGGYWQPCIERRRVSKDKLFQGENVCRWSGCGRRFENKECLARHLVKHVDDPAPPPPPRDCCSHIPSKRIKTRSAPLIASPTVPQPLPPPPVERPSELSQCPCGAVFERIHWPYKELIVRTWAHPYFVLFDAITKLGLDVNAINRVPECYHGLVKRAQNTWASFENILGEISPEEYLDSN